MSTEVKEKEKVLSEHLEKKEFWWWAEKARSPRIDYLRKAVWPKAAKGSSYLPGTKICWFGYKVFPKVFGSDDAKMEPYMLTWAKAQAKVLDEIPIFIIDQSRIVGYCGSAPHTLYMTPSISFNVAWDMYNDRLDLVGNDEDRPWIKEAIEFLKPYTYEARVDRILSRRQRIMCSTSQTFTGSQHRESQTYVTTQWDYFTRGIKNTIADLDKNIAEAEKVLYEVGARPDFPAEYAALQKLDNWRAMKICLEAVIRWANRYSRLAKIIAENFETDPQRKQELMEISRICAKVPAEAPETYYEWLQYDNLLSRARKYEWGEGAWSHKPDYFGWP